MKHLVTTFILLILMSKACLSQDAKMIVEISNDTILMGNYIQLKYTIENEQGNFEMPELEGLMVISGPNTSSSMSMVNNVVSQKSSYTVYLKPVDIGNHNIGPAYIETGKGMLESEPINIVVLDNPDGLQQNTTMLKLLEEVTTDNKSSSPKKKKVKRYKI